MQGRLIKTISFVEALPPFGTKQWRLLAMLLLDALSVQRVSRLGVHFSNNRSMMRNVFFDNLLVYSAFLHLSEVHLCYVVSGHRVLQRLVHLVVRSMWAGLGRVLLCLYILIGAMVCNTCLHRCWILLERVKRSTMFFVMWCSLWVARQLFQRVAVADLPSYVPTLG